MDALREALHDSGGVAAPRERARSCAAFSPPSSSAPVTSCRSPAAATPDPATVAIARDLPGTALVAVLPVAPALRADPAATSERAWLLTAAVVGALLDGGGAGRPEAGAAHGALAGLYPGESLRGGRVDPDSDDLPGLGEARESGSV